MFNHWLRSCTLLFLLLLAILLIIGYTYVKDPAVWPIRSVQITTELKHIKSETVQNLVTPYVTASFFTVKIVALQQELAQLPWVETVDIERVWPDKIRIAVREKKPALRWKKTGLISTRGVLFYPETIDAAQLPALSGPDVDYKKVVSVFVRLSAELATKQLSIVALDLSPRSAWSMRLSNGLSVYLGQNDIDNRWARFIQVTDEWALKQIDATYVDLRYTNGFALGK